MNIEKNQLGVFKNLINLRKFDESIVEKIKSMLITAD
jgi:hypothetical protein